MRRVRRSAGAGLAAVCLTLVAANAFAQARAPRKPPTRELDVGVAWTGRSSYGSADANLTTAGGGTQPLFSTSSEMGAGAAIEAHLAFRVTDHLRAEATGSWLRSELRTRTSADFEGAEPLTLSLQVSSFSAEGSGLWSFRPRQKFDPFVRAGAGWVRELTDGSVLAADSLVANVGGGVKYWWRQRVGLRSELRAVIRSGGLELATGTRRISPVVTASAAFRF